MTQTGSTPQSTLWDQACAMARRFPIVMVRIEYDRVAGKKIIAKNPAKGWHTQPAPTADQITAQIKAGCNAYLYRLPEGWHVLDADTPAAVAWAQQQFGPPDVHTARGHHWILDHQVLKQQGVDTHMRQLYGPGSFYDGPAGLVTYTGTVPAGPRPVPEPLRGAVASTREFDTPAPDGFFAAPPTTRSQAVGTMRSKLVAIEEAAQRGPESGARLAIMSAAMYAGGLLHAEWFSEEEAYGSIRDACARAWGQPSDEDDRWIEDGIRDGARKPLPTMEELPTLGPPPGKADRPAGLAGRIYTPEEIDARPKPDALISEWVDENSIALIFGPGGSAKSFIAFDMAASVANGIPWQGHEVKKTNVLFVAGEGSDGLGARSRAWRHAHDGMSPGVDIVDGAVDLFGMQRPGDLPELGQLIMERHYGLVVFDTYARCTPGLDENSAKETGLVLERMEALRALGCTVLVVHHTPKDGGTPRGSAALIWGTKHAISVSKKRGDPLVTLVNDRQKEAADGGEPLSLVLLGEEISGSAYLRETVDEGTDRLAAEQTYDPAVPVELGPEIDFFVGPGRRHIRDLAAFMAQRASGGVSISRSEAAGYLGVPPKTGGFRDAWTALVDLGALRLASGKLASGSSFWVPPGDERQAELTRRVING